MCIVEDKLVKKLAQDVAEIKDALLGNEYNRKGLVERVEDLEKEVLKLNTIRIKTNAYSAGIATTVSIIVALITKLFF